MLSRLLKRKRGPFWSKPCCIGLINCLHDIHNVDTWRCLLSNWSHLTSLLWVCVEVNNTVFKVFFGTKCDTYSDKKKRNNFPPARPVTSLEWQSIAYRDSPPLPPLPSAPPPPYHAPPPPSPLRVGKLKKLLLL